MLLCSLLQMERWLKIIAFIRIFLKARFLFSCGVGEKQIICRFEILTNYSPFSLLQTLEDLLGSLFVKGHVSRRLTHLIKIKTAHLGSVARDLLPAA